METILLTLVGVGLTDSLKLKRQLGAAGGAELSWRHERVVRETLSAFPVGQELEKGLDSFLIGFPKPPEAVQFALQLQRRMRVVFADNPTPVLDSIGIHFGNVLFEPGAGSPKIRSVFGTPVDLCKLLMTVANPGQILLTRFPFEHARRAFQNEEFEDFGELRWVNHGYFVIQGVEDPVELCEVGEPRFGPLTAPNHPDAHPLMNIRPVGRNSPSRNHPFLR